MTQSVNEFNGQPLSVNYWTLLEERQKLPIWGQKAEFIDRLKKNSILFVTGAKGSGKSTQIPQFCLEWARNEEKGRVACAQPKMASVISTALRVAQEMDVDIGQEVGYGIRFEEKNGEKTILKYLTDGLMMREALKRPLFDEYSVIIIDEVHERSLNTDILLSWLKTIINGNQRDNLKIVLLSDSRLPKIESYFEDCSLMPVGELGNEAEATNPSIPHQSDLKNMVLILKKLGVNDLKNFDFINRPFEEQLNESLNQLANLGALNSGELTDLGSRMTEFPLEVELSRALLKSCELGCREDVLSIISMLSGMEREDYSNESLNHESSDHLTLLNVYKNYLSNRYLIRNAKMSRVDGIRDQLAEYLNKFHLTATVSNPEVLEENILKSLLAGYRDQVAHYDGNGQYKTIRGNLVTIGPLSSLNGQTPQLIFYSQLNGKKNSMQIVSVIKKEWL